MFYNGVVNFIWIGGKRMEILLILYMVLGYWASGKVVYRNYIMIGTMSNIITRKLIVGFLFGWILIPIAILMSIFGK